MATGLVMKMFRAIAVALVLTTAAFAAACAEDRSISFISPIEGEELLEGEELTIRWKSEGPTEQVRLYRYYQRCPLGGESRGTEGRILFGQKIPDDGERDWTVPWIDAPAFRLRIASYDGEGELLAEQEIRLEFRPAELAHLPDHAIGIIKDRQRLYYYFNGEIERMHLISTGVPGKRTPRMQPGDFEPGLGEMGQVFAKDPNRWSHTYEVWMPYWLQITSTGSHGIHATSERYYDQLGSRASAGCVRQHEHDARVLYELVGVGTPVYIF